MSLVQSASNVQIAVQIGDLSPGHGVDDAADGESHHLLECPDRGFGAGAKVACGGHGRDLGEVARDEVQVGLQDSDRL